MIPKDISGENSFVEQKLFRQWIEKTERTRFSKKLHYDVGSLSGVKLALEILKATESISENGVRELSKAIDFLGRTCSDYRDLIGYYRLPYLFDDISFCDAVRQNCGRLNNGLIGIEIDVRSDHSIRCHQLKYDLFRIFQEVFLNAVKHSRGDKVLIMIDGDEQFMHLQVKDNGIGGVSWPNCEKESEDLPSGLNIIKERVRLLGGKVSLDSPLGEGTIVSIEVPLL